MPDIHYAAVLIASILQFVCGAFCYTFLFGSLWGKIHGFDRVPKEEQERMMKGMLPLYLVQFAVTVVTTFVLAMFMGAVPVSWNAFGVAAFVWLGFMLPTQASGVIFGGTEPKWIVKKIAVMAGASFMCLMVAAATLKFF